MQRLARLIIQIAFATLVIGTSSTSAQVKPDLEASDFYWRRSGVVGVSAHSFPADRGQATNYPPTDEVSALFRSVGHKVIKSVTWKYVFYKDEQRTEELAVYKFSSNKTIKPGGSARLKQSVLSISGPRRWTDYQAVVISRIEYADRTVWSADKIKK
jgi:hypothetical protein